jgi:hypothetical protein
VRRRWQEMWQDDLSEVEDVEDRVVGALAAVCTPV